MPVGLRRASPTCSRASSARSSSRWYIRAVGRISQAVLLDLRKRVFLHTQRLSLEFHESYTSGRIISRQTSDLDAIRELLDEGINQLVRGVLYMAFTRGRARSCSTGTSALVLLVALVPLARAHALVPGALAAAVPASRAWLSAKLIVHFVETMTGIRAVQGVPQGAAQREGVRRPRRGLPRRERARSIQLFGIFDPGLMLIGNVVRRGRARRGRLPRRRRRAGGRRAARGAALHAAVLRPDGGDGDVLQLVPVGGGRAREDLGRARGGAERARPAAARSTSGRRTATCGSRTSSSRTRPTASSCRDFDLDIPAGQTIALVGSTGAGKSTLAKLIVAVLRPDATARSTLDGVDLRSLHPKDLRRAIVMVTQEAYLFAGSVADNIALGKPDATLDEIVGRREGGGRARVHRGRCRTATTPT